MCVFSYHLSILVFPNPLGSLQTGRSTLLRHGANYRCRSLCVMGSLPGRRQHGIGRESARRRGRTSGRRLFCHSHRASTILDGLIGWLVGISLGGVWWRPAPRSPRHADLPGSPVRPPVTCPRTSSCTWPGRNPPRLSSGVDRWPAARDGPAIADRERHRRSARSSDHGPRDRRRAAHAGCRAPSCTTSRSERTATSGARSYCRAASPAAGSTRCSFSCATATIDIRRARERHVSDLGRLVITATNVDIDATVQSVLQSTAHFVGGRSGIVLVPDDGDNFTIAHVSEPRGMPEDAPERGPGQQNWLATSHRRSRRPVVLSINDLPADGERPQHDHAAPGPRWSRPHTARVRDHASRRHRHRIRCAPRPDRQLRPPVARRARSAARRRSRTPTTSSRRVATSGGGPVPKVDAPLR